jgi:hypothetical protein
MTADFFHFDMEFLAVANHIVDEVRAAATSWSATSPASRPARSSGSREDIIELSWIGALSLL